MPAQDANPNQNEQPLSPAETRRALWVAAIAWGIFGSAWMSLISGAVFVNFARSLGASTFMFGLLCSLPFLGVLAQLPSAYIVERTRRRRRLFLCFGSSQRLVWLAVAALPWVIPRQYQDARVGVLLALVVLSAALGNTASPAWLSWFADIVPERIRARYLGKRAALATVTAVIASGLVGWVLDRNSSFLVFTIIFSIAAVLGLTDLLLFLLIREAPMEKHEGPAWRLGSVVKAPLSSRPFRGYLLYALSEAVVFGIAGPFFWLMGLEVLQIGNFWSNFYIIMVPMTFTALTLPLWGNMCDRFGAKPLVTLGTLMTIAFPVCWLLATGDLYHPLLAAAAVLGGSFGAARQVADMSMLFALTPRQNRSAYITMLSVAASLGWVIAPSLGGAIAQVLKPVTIHLAGRAFGNLHFLMAISIAVRLLHVLLIVPRLPEEPRETTGGLIRHLCCWPLRWMGGVFTRPRG